MKVQPRAQHEADRELVPREHVDALPLKHHLRDQRAEPQIEPEEHLERAMLSSVSSCASCHCSPSFDLMLSLTDDKVGLL